MERGNGILLDDGWYSNNYPLRRIYAVHHRFWLVSYERFNFEYTQTQIFTWPRLFWNLGFASVDIDFLRVTISHVTLSCSQYLYNIQLKHKCKIKKTLKYCHYQVISPIWRKNPNNRSTRDPWATSLTWEISSNQWIYLSKVMILYIIKVVQLFGNRRFLNFVNEPLQFC